MTGYATPRCGECGEIFDKELLVVKTVSFIGRLNIHVVKSHDEAKAKLAEQGFTARYETAPDTLAIRTLSASSSKDWQPSRKQTPLYRQSRGQIATNRR